MKQETIVKADSAETSDVKQRLAQHILQKQIALLKLEESMLLLSFIISGVLGRVLLQGLPSVEPITFFALLAGSLFGWKKGLFAGATAWYLSNFFMFGGQGPWSLIQCLFGALAGFIGGFFLKKINIPRSFAAMFIATLVFEIFMNISSGFFFGFGIIMSFITAIPFSIIHIASNCGFSIFLPKAKKLIQDKGGLEEKELYKEMLYSLKSQRKTKDA
jgi:hypothetical protein